MASVSAGDLTLLRADDHRAELYLSIFVPDDLWTARVNNGSAALGDTAIIFDGGAGSAFAAIEALQEVWVGTTAGDDDLGRARVRSISSGDGGVTGTLTVAANGITWANNAYLTFKHDYPPKPLFPKLDSGGTFYKDRDIPYGSNYNSQPDPVTIVGNHEADFVDATAGYWEYTVDLTNSYPVANGASMASYSVSVYPTTGVTINVTSGTGYIRFATPGKFWGKFTSTDSNGKSQVTYRRFHAADPVVGNAEYPYRNFQLQNLGGDWGRGGWEASVIMDDDFAITELPAGAMAILWQRSFYGTTEKRITQLPNNSAVVLAGYTRREQIVKNLENGEERVSFQIVTVERLLDMQNFSVALEAIAGTPSVWYEYASWLTVGRIIHHVLDWHTNILTVADVFGLTDNTDGRAFGDMESGAVYSVLNGLARDAGIRAQLVCDQGGRMHLTPDIQLLIDGERSGLSTVQDITINDRGGPITIIYEPSKTASMARVSGFYFPGTFTDGEPDVEPYCAVAPGDVPADDGRQIVSLTRQVLTSQSQANQLAGRLFAATNNEFPEVRLSFKGNYLGTLGIHLNQFWTISLLSTENPRQIVWSNKRMICRSINGRFNNTLGDWVVEAVFEPEADGFTGITTDCLGFPSLGGETIIIPDPSARSGALVSAGSVKYLTPNSNAWTQLTAEATADLIADPYWRSRQGSGASASAILLRCGTGYIKRSTDGGTNWSTITPAGSPTNDANDSPAPAWANVDFHMLAPDWSTEGTFFCVARWQNADNVWRSWLLKTTDDGANWTNVQLGRSGSVARIDWDLVGGGGGTTTDYRSAVAILDSTNFIAFGTTASVAWYSVDGNYAITERAEEITFAANNLSMAALTSTKAIAVYNSGAVGSVGHGLTEIYEISTSPDTLTVTHSNAFSTTTTVIQTAVVAISATKVLVVYTLGSPSTAGIYAKIGTISGTAVSWSTPTTVITGTFEDIGLAYMGSDDSVLTYTYNDGGGDDIYAVMIDTSGATPSVGTPSEIVDGSTWTQDSTDTTSYGQMAAEHHTIRYDATTAIRVFEYAEFSIGMVAFTYTGTGISAVGTPVDIGGGDSSASLDRPTVTLQGSTIVIASAQNDIDKVQLNTATLSGTTITVGNLQDFVLSTPNSVRYWPAIYDLDGTALVISTVDWGFGSASSGAAVMTVNLSGTSLDAKVEGLDITKDAGAIAWVTMLTNESRLGLLKHATSDLSLTSVYDLGASTLAELSAQTWRAHPVTPFGDDDQIWVYGRMDGPQSLASPSHIIKSLNAGSSWSAVITDWGANFCSGMLIALDGTYIPFRSTTSSTKVYLNSVVASTLPFDAYIDPHNIAYDWAYGTLYVASNAASTIIVVRSVFPYLSWVDITYDHGNTGVNALELL